MQESKRQQDEVYEVWPEHWDAVRLLMACDTQWIAIAGMRGVYWQGLDFTRAASIAQTWLGLAPNPQLFNQLHTLVLEARPLRNKHLDRD